MNTTPPFEQQAKPKSDSLPFIFSLRKKILKREREKKNPHLIVKLKEKLVHDSLKKTITELTPF